MSTDDAAGHEALEPITPPPDFPVSWDRTDDARLSWHLDIMHFPEQMTPMTAGFNSSFADGFYRAARACEIPIRMMYNRINTYNYNATVPMVPPEEMEAQGKKAEQKLQEMVGRLSELWENEWLPEIHEHLAYWAAFDLPGASMPALLTHMEETWSRFTRLWDIHFLAAFPFLLAPSLFSELYKELFSKASDLGSYVLLQGFGNKTVDGGHALWDLSRRALASPELRKVLGENAAAEVSGALERSAEGRAFLDELRVYLEEYGHRSDKFCEFGDPHWVENPVTPIKNLQDYIQQPDRELRDELTGQAAQRERAIGEAREGLKGYPQPVVDQFEALLSAAQTAHVIQEDHNHWIDQRATYEVRCVLLEFGSRLTAAGVIEIGDDVFYLTPEELKLAASALPGGDRRQLVAERRAEMDRFRAVNPPQAIGTSPPGPPPDDPLGRALGKCFGAPPAESADPDVLLGNPSSPGAVRGTAKVVLSLADAGKIQPGDVLVAPATMPAWTPLFASIAAVVTDVGGVLSHAAIVAREYNIPAVLGTGNGTSVLRDGQMVEVDGDAGTVRIV